MMEREGCQLSVRTQCRLPSVNRSTVYYQQQGVKQSDLAVMRLLDEQYTGTPQYGVERMTAQLQRKGIVTGHNRVRRLMRLMGHGLLCPEAGIVADVRRRVCNGVPGSQAAAGHPTDRIGIWDSRIACMLQQAEEARRGHGDTAVGPAHSRGVAGVMPGAGSGSLRPTRRGRQSVVQS